jgi:hypothetical protein
LNQRLPGALRLLNRRGKNIGRYGHIGVYGAKVGERTEGVGFIETLYPSSFSSVSKMDHTPITEALRFLPKGLTVQLSYDIIRPELLKRKIIELKFILSMEMEQIYVNFHGIIRPGLLKRKSLWDKFILNMEMEQRYASLS